MSIGKQSIQLNTNLLDLVYEQFRLIHSKELYNFTGHLVLFGWLKRKIMERSMGWECQNDEGGAKNAHRILVMKHKQNWLVHWKTEQIE
jgi:hypothetical protein